MLCITVFSGPIIQEEISWLTTDATLKVIGVVDWENRTFIRADADQLMKFYIDKDGMTPGIADKELVGLVLGGVAGYAAHPGTILFLGVDSLNAVYWVIKGKSRGKFARKLLSNFLLWCVYNGIEVIIFYLRTNRNVTADEITRVEENALVNWGNFRGLTRVDLPDQWGSLRSSCLIWTGRVPAIRLSQWS